MRGVQRDSRLFASSVRIVSSGGSRLISLTAAEVLPRIIRLEHGRVVFLMVDLLIFLPFLMLLHAIVADAEALVCVRLSHLRDFKV